MTTELKSIGSLHNANIDMHIINMDNISDNGEKISSNWNVFCK